LLQNEQQTKEQLQRDEELSETQWMTQQKLNDNGDDNIHTTQEIHFGLLFDLYTRLIRYQCMIA
jgi:hypothetical protein